ncbi:MAG: PAS domain S-box protein [Aureispira sp.]|nr:PAS domain S-box protein [Aureispira sp.]
MQDLNNIVIANLPTIIDAMIDGVVIIDARGCITVVNKATCKIFGYEEEELVGANVSILMGEPNHSNHDQYIDNYHQTGTKKIIGVGREVEGRKKNGITFPLFLSITEIEIDGNLFFVGVIHDMSLFKEMEAAQLSSSQILKAIFDTAVDGIVTINKRGVITMANKAVSKLFGYTHKELLGQNVSILMTTEDEQQHDRYIDNYHKTKRKKIIGIGREVMGRMKNGKEFPIALSISEIKLAEGVVYAGILHDISAQKAIQKKIEELNVELEEKVEERTDKLAEAVNKLLSTNSQLQKEIVERKKIEEELRKSQAEVEKALAKERELSELKSRFVSMASHEFRTPLSTILSSASLIERYTTTETNDKRDKHIGRIKSAIRNLTNILNDFLSLSKLEEGKMHRNYIIFDVRTLAESVIEEVSVFAKKGQEIIYTQHGDNVEVYLDQQFTKNIMINLLSNAIKYSGENSQIDLVLTLEANSLNIKIKDQGMGIPIDDQKHLFERFFRAQNAMNIQGTGLGLNIVKRYVDLMKGEVIFESVPNKGTTFTVVLPRALSKE